MNRSAKTHGEAKGGPVRVLGRGLGAQRGIRLTLRALREAAGKTQVELTEITGIDQADISRLESRDHFDDCQVSTLQRYVAALGGTLGLVAAFGDKRFILVGSEPATVANRLEKKPVPRRRKKRP